MQTGHHQCTEESLPLFLVQPCDLAHRTMAASLKQSRHVTISLPGCQKHLIWRKGSEPAGVEALVLTAASDAGMPASGRGANRQAGKG